MKDDNNQITRAAIYIRVSTEEQAKHGYSLDSQLKRLKEHCKEKGYKLVDTYADEGKSARSKLNSRKELLRLLEDIEHNKINMVVIWRLDRWFRSVPDYYKVNEILEKHNCAWECSDEEYNTTTANGRLYLNIKLSIAQNESDQTGDRIRFNFENMIKQKKAIFGNNNLPIGYQVAGEKKNKHVVKNLEEEQYVYDLFDQYELTMSISKTTAYLVEKYPTYHFTYFSVKNILTSTLFYGTYKGVENYCEPYITKERYDNIQNLLKKNQKKKRDKFREYLFTGILICPICKRRLSANTSTRVRPNGEKQERSHYRCPKCYIDHQCSNKRVLQENIIEEWLLNNFKDILEEYLIQVEDIREQISQEDNTKKIESIKSKIDRLKELYIEGNIDREKFDSTLEKYNKEIKEYEKKSTKDVKIDLEKIKEFLNDSTALDVYNKLTKANKRAFWNSFIDYMYFTGNRDYNFDVFLK